MFVEAVAVGVYLVQGSNWAAEWEGLAQALTLEEIWPDNEGMYGYYLANGTMVLVLEMEYFGL
jgi:hypothetical protein